MRERFAGSWLPLHPVPACAAHDDMVIALERFLEDEAAGIRRCVLARAYLFVLYGRVRVGYAAKSKVEQ